MIALVIAVFAIVATATCIRNQNHPWEDLEGVTAISLSPRGACVVRTDGSAVCWGTAGEPPDREFVSVSVGRHHACGLTTGGSVACWNSDGDPWISPPGDGFVAVSSGISGIDYACGIAGEGSLHCWGTSFSQSGAAGRSIHRH